MAPATGVSSCTAAGVMCLQVVLCSLSTGVLLCTHSGTAGNTLHMRQLTYLINIPSSAANIHVSIW